MYLAEVDRALSGAIEITARIAPDPKEPRFSDPARIAGVRNQGPLAGLSAGFGRRRLFRPRNFTGLILFWAGKVEQGPAAASGYLPASPSLEYQAQE